MFVATIAGACGAPTASAVGTPRDVNASATQRKARRANRIALSSISSAAWVWKEDGSRCLALS
jgi:hypothetical protein